jgi:hypothetical protein
MLEYLPKVVMGKAPLIAAVELSHAKLSTSLHLSSPELAPAQLRGRDDVD